MFVLLWLYSIVGTGYLILYLAVPTASEVIAKFLGGPLWLMMGVAPIVLLFLVLNTFIVEFRKNTNSSVSGRVNQSTDN